MCDIYGLCRKTEWLVFVVRIGDTENILTKKKPSSCVLRKIKAGM